MFWLRVFNDRKPRGVNDILVFVVDGLKGLAEAIETALPQTTVQTCIVHLICNSISYASLKDRKAGVSKALRPIVRHRPWRPPWRRWRRLPPAPGAHKCQTIAPAWQRAWSHMIPFFAFSPGGAARDLYHQRDRELARSAQEEAMNQFAIIYGDRFTQVAV